MDSADPIGVLNFSALVLPQGWQFPAPENVTLLQSANKAGLALPASCRNGTCRACICRLGSGRVSYRIAWPGLSREEKEDGFILPCVAYPESDIAMEVPGAMRLEQNAETNPA